MYIYIYIMFSHDFQHSISRNPRSPGSLLRRMQKSEIAMDCRPRTCDHVVGAETWHRCELDGSTMWGFPWPWGSPIAGGFIVENPHEIMDDDWGYPHVWKPPCGLHIPNAYSDIPWCTSYLRGEGCQAFQAKQAQSHIRWTQLSHPKLLKSFGGKPHSKEHELTRSS